MTYHVFTYQCEDLDFGHSSYNVVSMNLKGRWCILIFQVEVSWGSMQPLPCGSHRIHAHDIKVCILKFCKWTTRTSSDTQLAELRNPAPTMRGWMPSHSLMGAMLTLGVHVLSPDYGNLWPRSLEEKLRLKLSGRKGIVGVSRVSKSSRTQQHCHQSGWMRTLKSACLRMSSYLQL